MRDKPPFNREGFDYISRIKQEIGFFLELDPTFNLMTESRQIEVIDNPKTVQMIMRALEDDETGLKEEFAKKVQNANFDLSEMTRQAILFLVTRGRKDKADKILANAAVMNAALRMTEFDDITGELDRETIGHILFEIESPKGNQHVDLIVTWHVGYGSQIETKMKVGPTDPGQLADQTRKLDLCEDYLKISQELLTESMITSLDDRINQNSGPPIFLENVAETNMFDLNLIADGAITRFSYEEKFKQYAFHFKPRTVTLESLRNQIRLLTEFSVDGKPL